MLKKSLLSNSNQVEAAHLLFTKPVYLIVEQLTLLQEVVALEGFLM